jgi:hypothetical protein
MGSLRKQGSLPQPPERQSGGSLLAQGPALLVKYEHQTDRLV